MDNYRDDYYDIIGVDSKATSSEIYESYIKLSKKNHPDLGGSNRIMQLINEAYNIIGDNSKRIQYDFWLANTKSKNTGMQKSKESEFKGAGNTKSGIMEVVTNTVLFSIPQICACCMRPYEKNIPMPFSSKTKSNTYIKSSLKMPLCLTCLGHLKKYRRSGTLIALGISITSVIFQSAMSDFFGIKSLLSALMAITATAISLRIYYGVRKKPGYSEEHHSEGPPIDLSIEQSGIKKFTFHNSEYGRLFLYNNPMASLHRYIENPGEIKKYYGKSRYTHVIGKAIAFSIVFCLLNAIVISAGNSDDGDSSETSLPSSNVTYNSSNMPASPSSENTVVLDYRDAWQGTWDTTYGELILKISADSQNTIIGYYPSLNGTLSGEISGNQLDGIFGEDGSSGIFTFILDEDGQTFIGTCKYNDSTSDDSWDGYKVSEEAIIPEEIINPPSPTATPEPTATPFPYDAQEKPETGLFKSYTSASAVAPFTVITSSDATDYFLRLVDSLTGQKVYEFYIRDAETLSLDIALGTYILRYASGAIWYGEEHLFGPDTLYSQGNDPLTFEQSGIMIYGYTVTLYKVAGGNFETESINPEEFGN